MTRGIAALGAALGLFLAGCAAVPAGTESSANDTRATKPFEASSKLDATAAAQCVAKHIEDEYGAFVPTLRKSQKPDITEVIVRSAAGVAAIVETSPTPQGSVITGWLSNHYPLKGLLFKQFIAGC
jgi:hypothetical protein